MSFYTLLIFRDSKPRGPFDLYQSRSLQGTLCVPPQPFRSAQRTLRALPYGVRRLAAASNSVFSAPSVSSAIQDSNPNSLLALKKNTLSLTQSDTGISRTNRMCSGIFPHGESDPNKIRFVSCRKRMTCSCSVLQ